MKADDSRLPPIPIQRAIQNRGKRRRKYPSLRLMVGHWRTTICKCFFFSNKCNDNKGLAVQDYQETTGCFLEGLADAIH